MFTIWVISLAEIAVDRDSFDDPGDHFPRAEGSDAGVMDGMAIGQVAARNSSLSARMRSVERSMICLYQDRSLGH